MSLSDGQMKHQHLYLTSDIALASYLLMKGFELLGAVDTGSVRKEFGLTHTDPEVLTHMEIHVKTLAEEYSRSDAKLFYSCFQELKHSLDEAVRKG